jgi:hypothetical protein
MVRHLTRWAPWPVVRSSRWRVSFLNGGAVLGREGGRHEGWRNLLILGKFRRVGLFPHSWRLRRPGLEALQNFATEGVDCC